MDLSPRRHHYRWPPASPAVTREVTRPDRLRGLHFAGESRATRLDDVVLAYDATNAETISKLLLVNIARAHQNLPLHFTGVSNVLATYRFTFSGGLGPAMTGDFGWLPMPQLSGSREESPTVSIAPMQGDEFTQRLLTPFHEQKLSLLLRQGYDVDALLRLLGAEVRLDGEGTAFAGVLPSDSDGYTAYRRVVSHLSAIQDHHALFIEPLHFLHAWTVPAESVTPEAFQTTYKDYALTYEPKQRTYRVTKRINGRGRAHGQHRTVRHNREVKSTTERRITLGAPVPVAENG